MESLARSNVHLRYLSAAADALKRHSGSPSSQASSTASTADGVLPIRFDRSCNMRMRKLGALEVNASNRKFVGDFWRNQEFPIIFQLSQLGMSSGDADEIGAYILDRFARVDQIFPNRTDEMFALMYAALVYDAISAAQRLFAVKWGRRPGELVYNWPLMQKKCDHPFLGG
jgi:hypothetical protein